jgi:hypothetical protein
LHVSTVVLGMMPFRRCNAKFSAQGFSQCVCEYLFAPSLLVPSHKDRCGKTYFVMRAGQRNQKTSVVLSNRDAYAVFKMAADTFLKVHKVGSCGSGIQNLNSLDAEVFILGSDSTGCDGKSAFFSGLCQRLNKPLTMIG